jgi:uncharacterized protein (DUF1015 family)
MNIYPFKASYPNTDLIASPESFFDTVSAEFVNFRHSGFFASHVEEALFIYRIQGSKTFTGIIASNDIEDIENKKILGHENTLTDKEQSMLQLMLSRKAMIKPVLLAYENKVEIDSFIEKYVTNNQPFFDIELPLNQEQHTIWAVSKPSKIERLQELFKQQVPTSYIADGHHRASITAKLVRKNYLHDDNIVHPGLLCVFFPFKELEILDYNRIIDLSGKMSKLNFMAKISHFVDIKPINKHAKPHKKHQMTMILDQEWFSLTWKKKLLKSARNNEVLLDVDLFNNHILKEVVNIKDIKTATDVMYVEGVSGLEKMEEKLRKSNDYVGFCLYPVSKDDMIKISDAGDVLPPKSTWFEPRIKNGLIIKEF